MCGVQSGVCIVGAGMMGLRTASRLEAEGIPYVLMDRKLSVGGVWSPRLRNSKIPRKFREF